LRGADIESATEKKRKGTLRTKVKKVKQKFS